MGGTAADTWIGGEDGGELFGIVATPKLPLAAGATFTGGSGGSGMLEAVGAGKAGRELGAASGGSFGSGVVAEG